MTKHLFKKIFCLLAILAIALVLIACDGNKVEAKLDFEKSTLTVEVGDEFDIKTTVSGVDASTAVEFTFDKDGIVKYENGKFTAVAAGEVKITGTVKGYSDATATLTVTVNEKPAQVNAKVKLTVAKTEGYAGDKINVSVALEDADDLDDQTVTFEVSSANATYADGVLTLVAVGEVTLTAKLASYPEIKDSVKITILEKEPTLTITPSATSVAAGGKVTVAAVADPATAEIEWSSSDEEVATVASGVVTALKNGKTTITATIKGTNVSQSFELTVAQLVTNISVQYVEEMEVFDYQDIVITVTPEDAGDKSVTITSSDEDVIIASNDGTLTALEAGTAVITVTANDGSGVKYEFTVTVTDSANIIENTLCDPAVANLASGTEYEYKGQTYVVDKTAFSTIELAIEATTKRVYVAAGTYDANVIINKDGIELYGPNAGVNAQYVNRDAEAVLGGPINFVEGISNFTVDGFEFTGAAALFPIKDCKNIAMKYCVINGTSTDGVIRSSTEAGGLVYDIKFIGNYSNNYKGLRVLHLTYCDGLDASNNYIQTTGATYDFVNSQQLLKGEVVFKDNTFIGGSNQSFIYARLIGNTNVLIQGNYVEDVVCTGIDFRDMTEENGKATFNILNNTLKNCGNDWRPIRIRTAGYKEGNEIVVNVNYNKFIDSYVVVDGQLTFVNNPSQGSVSDPFNVIYNMDNNYYEVDGDVIIPDSNDYFGGAALSWEGSYASESDMPAYSAANEVKPTSLEITNKITNMDAYDTYQLTFQIGPSDATNKKIAFKTSNASAATVSSAGLISAKSGGTATITAYCVADNSVVDSLTITVAPKSRVEIRCEGNGILYVNGATAKLETTYYGSGNGGITYTSSDPTIATVDASGVVTGLKAGQVEITASQDGKEAKISFTVLTEELTGVLKVLADGNHATIWNQNIFYIGSDDGSADYEHNIYGSANDYYAGTLPEVQLNMLASTAPNNPNQKMKSVEFIVVHDTAGSPSTSTAYANSHWCTNPSNSGTSWHYTIGNDGIYKQAEDDMVMWHAGDGTAWGESTTFYDTGIPYEGDRPTVTVGNDNYFYVNGKKSNVMSPTTETKTINTLGLVCVKGDNGNYFIPTTYVNSSFNGAHICARGGGLNGIGIETAVNMGSDVYLTWQYTAKFCAALVIKHNLAADRIWFHNNFSNKKCPNTMITANRVDTFLKLVYAEYEIAKNYSDYEIKFESSNPSILDNTGRVVKTPEYTTNVSYKVIVTKGTDVQELTLNTLVIGQYNL